MKELGFQNFRRFKSFPKVRLSDSNILVGANNSGKSTFVKAAMLVFNFMKNGKAIKDGEMPKFYFSGIPHVNIDTFDRALCADATDRTITFSVSLETEIPSCFDIIVSRDVDKGDRGYANVEKIICSLFNENDEKERTLRLVLTFDFLSKSIEIYSSGVDGYAVKQIDDLNSVSIPINCNTEKYDNLILSLFDDIISYSEDDEREVSYNGIFSNKAFLSQDDKEVLQNCAASLELVRNDLAQTFTWPIEYIYAHGTSQNPLFDTKNLNDINAKVVEDYYKICGYQPVKDFVCKWLKEFQIGTSLSIECFEGTAYKVCVSKKGMRKTNIGDMGMGTIQIVILILHLAEIISKLGGFYDSTLGNRSIIFIEEPEQNLHPALQSKLADLFLDITRNYGGQYVIETHSEYFVRRTQVIVAEENSSMKMNKRTVSPSRLMDGYISHKKAEEIFSVYYFDKDEPREMKYQKSGRFNQSFGPGFFDEAGKWNLRLIAIRKGKDNA